MKIQFKNRIISFLILLSLFVPLLSNALIMVPSNNITIDLTTQGLEGNFHFTVKSQLLTCDQDGNNCQSSWVDYDQFDLQTQGLLATKTISLDQGNYMITQDELQGLNLQPITCISDFVPDIYTPWIHDSFIQQENGIAIYPAGVWENIVCSFNNKKVADKTPVLIVPGIMGTEMKNGSELLWPDILRMSYTIGDGFMDPLSFNKDLTPSNSSVSTGKVVENPDKLADYTEGLKKEFVDQGYIEGETLFTFPYDWRYGISGEFADGTTNVDLLKNKIEIILAQTGKDKIEIVAHSMGGILTKKYVIDNSANHKINKAIFVGVPNLGSPEVVKTLIQGDNMGIPFLSDSEVKKISENMPGAYDLIPSQTYYDSYGSFIKTIEYAGLTKIEKDLNYQETKSFLVNENNLNSTALTQAESLRSDNFDTYDIKSTGIDLYNIVGCKSSTMTKFIKSKNTNPLQTSVITYDIPETGNGDGTVPINSSNSVGASNGNTFYTIKTKHSDMLSGEGSKQEIVNLIAGTNLNTGNNVITKAVLDANPEKCELSGWWLKWFSPVTIEITDQSGNRSGIATDGSIQNQIPGASYDLIGDHKFIFIPNDENQTYTINFKGDDAGTYTLINSQITNGQTTKTESFINLSVTSQLTGTVNLPGVASQTTLTVKETPTSESQVIYPTPDDIIAPEVIIEFDPAKKDLKFTGKDNVSTSSEITNTDKDDTITLTDKAGNITEIKLKDKNRKITMKAEIKSIKYNGKLADTSKNKMAFLWLYDKNKNLKMLSQYVASKKDYNVLAVYNGKNTTLIGKDASGKILKTEKGLKILKVTTNNGDLNWSY